MPALIFYIQVEEARRTESPAAWISDRRSEKLFCFDSLNKVSLQAPIYGFISIDLCFSLMAPLIAEYDRHMDEMTEQLHRYQVENQEMFFIHFKVVNVETHKYVEYLNI